MTNKQKPTTIQDVYKQADRASNLAMQYEWQCREHKRLSNEAERMLYHLKYTNESMSHLAWELMVEMQEVAEGLKYLADKKKRDGKR